MSHHRWLVVLLVGVTTLCAVVLWQHSERMGWLWLPLALGYVLCLMPLVPLLVRPPSNRPESPLP